MSGEDVDGGSFQIFATSGDCHSQSEGFYRCLNEYDLQVDNILSTSLLELDDDSVTWLINRMSMFFGIIFLWKVFL